MMETLWQDLRYGVRMLGRNPGFTAVAVLTLALGIGANTAIFSVVNTVLLRPLPYPEPEEIVRVFTTPVPEGLPGGPASAPNFIDWKEQNQVFERLAAFRIGDAVLTGYGEPERISVGRMTSDFFPLLGIIPITGRNLLPEEDRPSSGRVALLTYGLWQRRWGGDPGIEGKILTLDGTSYSVVGVLPEGFRFQAGDAEIWTSGLLHRRWLQQRGLRSLWALGRLKRGVTLERAQAEMELIARRLNREYPEANQDSGIHLVRLHEQLVGNTRPALLVLLGAVGFVLLITCVNVANLMLLRASGRQREVAIRAALGAGQGRLFRQVMTESCLLAVLGGAAGLLLALWSADLLLAVSMRPLPRLDEFRVDGRVLGFSLAASLFAGLLSGLAPAFKTSRINLSEALKTASRHSGSGPTRPDLRKGLVATEVALALVLLIGAGLMINSFLRLRSVEPGFRPENIITAQLSLPVLQYRQPRQQADFFDQVLQRVNALSEVEAAAAVSPLPLSGVRYRTSAALVGKQYPVADDVPEADWRVVSPGYFRAMGIPLHKGRHFTDGRTR